MLWVDLPARCEVPRGCSEGEQSKDPSALASHRHWGAPSLQREGESISTQGEVIPGTV